MPDSCPPGALITLASDVLTLCFDIPFVYLRSLSKHIDSEKAHVCVEQIRGLRYAYLASQFQLPGPTVFYTRRTKFRSRAGIRYGEWILCNQSHFEPRGTSNSNGP